MLAKGEDNNKFIGTFLSLNDYFASIFNCESLFSCLKNYSIEKNLKKDGLK